MSRIAAAVHHANFHTGAGETQRPRVGCRHAGDAPRHRLRAQRIRWNRGTIAGRLQSDELVGLDERNVRVGIQLGETRVVHVADHGTHHRRMTPDPQSAPGTQARFHRLQLGIAERRPAAHPQRCTGRARLEEDDHSSTHGPNRIAQTSEFGRTPRLGTSGKGHADKQCRGNHGKESHVTTHRLLSAQCAVEMLDPQGLQVIPTADAGDSASLATNDVAVAPWFCGPDFRRVCSEQRQRSGRNQRPPDCCEIMHESFQTIIAGKMAL